MDLYVSDLDGTLLNSNQEVSIKSARIINDLINKGLIFTVATARPGIDLTKAAIKPLKISVPIVIGNGAIIYDLSKKQRVACNYVDTRQVNNIINIFSKLNLIPSIYSINNNNETKIYYKDISNECEKRSMLDKMSEDSNMFIKTDELLACTTDNIIYISVCVEEKSVKSVYNMIKDELDLQITYHEDNYVKGYYWIEIANKKATKKDAVLFLKEYLNCDKVICFGDNLNDKGMFEVSDYKYAVNNACNALKNISTNVIGSNNEDGVAIFMKENYKV